MNKSFRYLRLYSAVIAIVLITIAPILRAVVEISDALMLAIIGSIGTVASAFAVADMRRERKNSEDKEDPQ